MVAVRAEMVKRSRGKYQLIRVCSCYLMTPWKKWKKERKKKGRRMYTCYVVAILVFFVALRKSPSRAL